MTMTSSCTNDLHGRRSRARQALFVAALTTILASFVIAAPAQAEEHHPTGDFSVFTQCPLNNPSTSWCVYAQTEKGEVKIGKKTVPISSTITLQGGFNENVTPLEFIGAENGETLSKTPQEVPGGLAGLVNCNEITEPIAHALCVLAFQNKLTGVNATTELAKPASAIGYNPENILDAEGVGLTLPVKIHLENPLLGSECYIGSSTSPVTLELTDGTTSPTPPTEPISGKFGKVHFGDEFSFIEISENTLVNNTFTAPKATGCGGALAFAIDPVVNLELGLPAETGNKAIMDNRIREGDAVEVKKSE
jgi:hypothetical protein